MTTSPDRQATTTEVRVAQDIMNRLERAWNAGSGTDFGEPFSSDADFVDIRGELHTGRDTIAEGHQSILDTIYAGSTVDYQVLQARAVDDRVVLAHVRATLDAPSGPLAGEHAATITVVLLKRDDEYEITSFHNALVTG
jgi:uncharacterized protein (TIGR02246 family)